MNRDDPEVDLFGRFGLMARRIAGQAFRVALWDANLVSTTSIRVPGDVLVRIGALAKVAGISRNRLMSEVLEQATDELEAQLQDSYSEQFLAYIHHYETACEQGIDARD